MNSPNTQNHVDDSGDQSAELQDGRRDSEEVSAIPEQNAIAQKYEAQIPPSDRNIGASNIKSALQLYERIFHNTLSNGNSDRIGNMPPSIMRPFNTSDAENLIAAMRECATDPLRTYADADKINHILNLSLPDSVKNSVVSIFLTEGDVTVSDIWNAMADALDAELLSKKVQDPEATLDSKEISAVFTEVQADYLKKSKTSDQVRQAATQSLLRSLYPDLLDLPEIKLLDILQDGSVDWQEDGEAAAKIVDQVRAILPSDDPIQEELANVNIVEMDGFDRWDLKRPLSVALEKAIIAKYS